MASIYLGHEELMGGCGYNPVCYGKKVGSGAKKIAEGTVKVIAAPVKGVGHTVMEVGRGLKSGDISKILTAPSKGVGHAIAESYRGGKKIVGGSVGTSFDIYTDIQRAPLDIIKSVFDVFKPKKKKAPKKPDIGFTPLEDADGGLPIVPILAVAAAAVGGYFIFKG